MFALMLALLTTAHANAPIQIQITDPQVQAVTFKCAGGPPFRVEVVNNKVSVGKELGKCDIVFERRGGTIDGPGRYSCDLNACTLEDVHHLPVTDAAGRINMIFTTASDSTGIELRCPNGTRERTTIVENTATFDGVTSDQPCQVSTLGGSPARFNNIGPGTWRCTTVGTTMLCNKPK